MYNFKNLLFAFMISICSGNNAFGQFRYFVKLFESNDKDFIALVEENSQCQRKIIQKIEDKSQYYYLKRELKEENSFEIAVPGTYITRSQFLNNRGNSLQNLEDELKIKTQKIISEGSPSGVEQSTAANTFEKYRLLSPIRYSEKNSLKNISDFQVFISIPETPKEFKNIFGSVNRSQFESSYKLRNSIASESNSNVHFVTNSDLLTDAILCSPEKTPLILIGHNEGGEFRFPDGTGRSFDGMDSLAKEGKRVIIYLSCNSNRYTDNPSTNFYLTYKDAIAITNRINNAYLNNADHLMLQNSINSIIHTYGKDKNQKYKYRLYTSWITISGITFTVYKIKQGNKK